MSNLRIKLKSYLDASIKKKDDLSVSTVRLIIAAIKDRDIEYRAKNEANEINDPEILNLLQNMIKQRKESVKIYADAGRDELKDREVKEIEIIESFLPKQITDASTLNKTSNESDKYTVKKYTENENCSLKNIYMISGSKDEQNAYDYFDSNNKISMGALTASFLTQLRKAKHNIYLSELHKNICQDLINKSFIDQTPCYSTSEEKENSDYVFDKNAKSVSNNKKISGKHTFYFNY